MMRGHKSFFFSIFNKRLVSKRIIGYLVTLTHEFKPQESLSLSLSLFRQTFFLVRYCNNWRNQNQANSNSIQFNPSYGFVWIPSSLKFRLFCREQKPLLRSYNLFNRFDIEKSGQSIIIKVRQTQAIAGRHTHTRPIIHISKTRNHANAFYKFLQSE